MLLSGRRRFIDDSMEYLFLVLLILFSELKKDSELISLKQLLNNFDFQIDND